MATAKEQLLSMMSPQQARLMDQQLRQQQVANRSQGAGMLSGLVQAYTGMGDIAQRAAGITPMGVTEMEAIQQNKQSEEAKQKKMEQLDSLRKQASEVIMASPEMGEQRASALLRAVEMDKTGSLSSKIVERFATQAIDTNDPYGHLSVVGNRVFNKKTEKYLAPPLDDKGKPVKLQDVAETYGISTKDLDPQEIANLGVIANDLNNQNKTPQQIQAALNSEIVSMFDKKEQASAEEKDRALRSQLNAMDSLITSAEQASELAPDSFAEATVDAIAGFLGVPWSDGLTLDNYVKQIQANLAFDRLQQMRDASKTGGALGQVSNIELELLKSSLTALDPKDDKFQEQLQTVIKHYKAFSASLRGRVPDGYREIDGRVFEFGSDGKWYEVLGEGNE